MGPDEAGDTRRALLRRYRCVAFAALRAGVTERELVEGLRVALVADRAEREHRPPAPRHLRAVPAAP